MAFGAALLTSACQHDSTANFDDGNLTSPAGGSATASGGSVGSGDAGSGAKAGGSAGGSKASAGAGGKASAGAAGNATGGKASDGGKAGSDTGGTTSPAGNGGQGGAAGSASGGGGTGGSVDPDPEPVTVETTDIDDTHVASCMPSQNFGEQVRVEIDGDQECRYETLMTVPLTNVPDGALVSEALLALNCTNVGGVVTVSYANAAWKELMVRWNTRPEVGATLGTITCTAEGVVSLDLTAAVQAWLSGAHAQHGISLRSESADGTDFASSESEKLSQRPRLSVTYTLPIK